MLLVRIDFTHSLAHWLTSTYLHCESVRHAVVHSVRVVAASTCIWVAVIARVDVYSVKDVPSAEQSSANNMTM